MNVPDQKSSDKAPFNIILALGGCVLLMCLVGAGIFLVAYSKIKAAPPAANETSQKVVLLEQLLKDYKEPTSSKPNTWEVQITSSQSVVIDMGWCALSEKILDQNIPHIQWTLEIDGKSIDISQISASRNVDSNQVCESRALQ